MTTLSSSISILNIVMVTYVALIGDEIWWRSSKFVTQRKNKISMPRPRLYKFQYRKIFWGDVKKVWRKEMFSSKSETKLADLTVSRIFHCSFINICRNLGHLVQIKIYKFARVWSPTDIRKCSFCNIICTICFVLLA